MTGRLLLNGQSVHSVADSGASTNADRKPTVPQTTPTPFVTRRYSSGPLNFTTYSPLITSAAEASVLRASNEPDRGECPRVYRQVRARPKPSAVTLCDQVACDPRRAAPNRPPKIQPLTLDVQMARSVTSGGSSGNYRRPGRPGRASGNSCPGDSLDELIEAVASEKVPRTIALYTEQHEMETRSCRPPRGQFLGVPPWGGQHPTGSIKVSLHIPWSGNGQPSPSGRITRCSRARIRMLLIRSGPIRRRLPGHARGDLREAPPRSRAEPPAVGRPNQRRAAVLGCRQRLRERGEQRPREPRALRIVQ
jgi:hypothetical protein